MPCSRSRDRLPRVQHHVGATGEGEVAFAVVQAATGHVHGEQTRRTCGVDRERGTVDAEGIGDPSGRHAEGVALEAVRPLHRRRTSAPRPFVVVMRQTHEHTGQ